MRGVNARKGLGVVADLCVFILAGGAMVVGGYLPLFAQRASLTEDIERMQERLEERVLFIEQDKHVERVYGHILRNYVLLGSHQQASTALFSVIETAAGKNALRITQVRSQDVKADGFSREFSWDLTLEGDLAHLMAFLHDVEGPPHRFAVSEVHLQQRIVRHSLLQCRVKLSRVFWDGEG